MLAIDARGGSISLGRSDCMAYSWTTIDLCLILLPNGPPHQR